MRSPNVLSPLSLSLAVISLCGILSTAARGQDDGTLLAIQQRKFQITHELDIGAVLEPQDAFDKGVAIEGAYIWHFSDFWSWEVLRAGYLAQIDTGLKSQLLNEFGTDPTQFETLQYYASSSLAYAPLYGKFALRNGSLIHAEAFVDLGAAFGRYTSSYQAGPELGVGLRVFLTQALSVRFDARDAIFLRRNNPNGVTNQAVFLSLGLAISLGGHER